MDQLDKILQKNIDEARHGMEYWYGLKTKTGIRDNDCVLLFPSDQDEINDTSLHYLNQLLNLRNYDGAVILSVDKRVVTDAKLYSDRIRCAMEISREDAASLMRYYAMLEFSNRFFICSLTEPEGRWGELLQKGWNFPLHELICAGVYRMYDYIP